MDSYKVDSKFPQKAKSLDIGTVLNESFEIYKKIVSLAGLSFILLSIIVVGISFGALGLFAGLDSFSSILTDFSFAASSSGGIVILVVVSAIGAALIAPFYAGILKISHNAANNQAFEFATIFEFYKGSHLKELIISSFIISTFSTLCSFGISVSGALFISSFFPYLVQFFTLLTIPFIIFGNLNAVDAIKSGVSVVTKNIFVVLILMIVALILAFLGLIALCVGVFFTLPIIYTTQYAIYRNAVGIDVHDEIDDIGTSLDL